MKNKRIIKIIAIVLAAVIAAGGITAYALLPHSLSYDIDSIPYVGSELAVITSSDDEVLVRKNSEVKVLMFTDLHLDGKNKTSNLTVKNLVDNIVREKPDLVILGGDNVTSAFNSKRANQLAEIFEKLGVYWAGILGNHEGDNSFSISRDDMVEIFSSYDHCLMRKGPENVWGSFNYSLSVIDEYQKMIHTFYFMDTGDEMTAQDVKKYGLDENDSHYDGTKESQVKWYTEKNNSLREIYEDFNSTVVVHIPLFQYEKAAESGKFLYGDKLENICESEFDSGLFEAIKKGGTTKSVFCGHDHLNTFGVEYDGILLSYIQPSGYGSYTTESRLGYEEKDWLQGYTVLNIKTDGTFESQRVRNSEVNAE